MCRLTFVDPLGVRLIRFHKHATCFTMAQIEAPLAKGSGARRAHTASRLEMRLITRGTRLNAVNAKGSHGAESTYRLHACAVTGARGDV